MKILCVEDPIVNFYLNKNSPIKKYEKKISEKIDIVVLNWNDYYHEYSKIIDNDLYLYDAFMCPGNLWLPDLILKNKILKIDDLDNYNFEDFFDSVKYEIYYKNNFYMFPIFNDGHIIYAKKKDNLLYDKVFLDYKNLKEFLLHYKNKFSLKASKNEIFLDFLPFYFNNNNNFTDILNGFSEFEDSLKKSIIDYLYIKKFCINGSEDYGNKEISERLKTNLLDAAISWSGQAIDILKNNKYDFNYYTYRKPLKITWGFVISKNTINFKKTLNFLKFLTNEENEIESAYFSGCPCRKKSYKYNFLPLKLREVIIKMLLNAKSLPSINGLTDLYSIFYYYLHYFYVNGFSDEKYKLFLKNIKNNNFIS
ncbi:extracellular solute-binding protein [Oceanotoga teriensis]|jgi:ABC-type glycerol-3-phosphate transport system substrate-binding protein|uniref:ABC-type glycerol-3-phosphate transport system substrate-binding protein n=1 Tax=Oceanotoga teriensis TaxID=515440 RepID=A0AA45HH93_9BACT|nr:extracellular solute-binding protein [Oceanotoga teriensis]MDO7975778.1 extracellular solute-binding protein [Oceanotoga teriensis]PWJ84716.1 ABC-type glycerol-3-phosphate transport system substrate-binding protein [Oceanotoga teriensis]